MKRTVTLLLTMLCTLGSFADETPGIVINKSDGTNLTLPTTSLRSIKFGDGEMLLSMKNGTQHVVSLNEITDIVFGDATTAINQLAGNNSDENVVITDLSGRVLYNGDGKGVASLNGLHGVYVITTKAKSHKVMIGK